ncbi:hypothetical protein EW146_g2612 [Bondarzewia mesenterica]|uniref:C2H2-type domain-containing protein n=1 Tax=Bondarzewia mesenterica TaxID=1095465 RepID=A0A4S4M1L9_9AGAM|nr:hypothetical protein EW146_g2612 [Bondarzewia mesenterica]
MYTPFYNIDSNSRSAVSNSNIPYGQRAEAGVATVPADTVHNQPDGFNATANQEHVNPRTETNDMAFGTWGCLRKPWLQITISTYSTLANALQEVPPRAPFFNQPSALSSQATSTSSGSSNKGDKPAPPSSSKQGEGKVCKEDIGYRRQHAIISRCSTLANALGGGVVLVDANRLPEPLFPTSPSHSLKQFPATELFEQGQEPSPSPSHNPQVPPLVHSPAKTIRESQPHQLFDRPHRTVPDHMPRSPVTTSHEPQASDGVAPSPTNRACSSTSATSRPINDRANGLKRSRARTSSDDDREYSPPPAKRRQVIAPAKIERAPRLAPFVPQPLPLHTPFHQPTPPATYLRQPCPPAMPYHHGHLRPSFQHGNGAVAHYPQLGPPPGSHNQHYYPGTSRLQPTPDSSLDNLASSSSQSVQDRSEGSSAETEGESEEEEDGAYQLQMEEWDVTEESEDEDEGQHSVHQAEGLALNKTNLASEEAHREGNLAAGPLTDSAPLSGQGPSAQPPTVYCCPTCGKGTFKTIYSVKRHQRSSPLHNVPKPYLCPDVEDCGATFSRADTLNQHMRRVHPGGRKRRGGRRGRGTSGAALGAPRIVSIRRMPILPFCPPLLIFFPFASSVTVVTYTCMAECSHPNTVVSLNASKVDFEAKYSASLVALSVLSYSIVFFSDGLEEHKAGDHPGKLVKLKKTKRVSRFVRHPKPSSLRQRLFIK